MLFDNLSALPIAAYIPLLLIFAAAVALLGSISGIGGGVLHIPVMVWVLTNVHDIKEIKFISTILVFISALINTIIAGIKKEISYWVIIVAIVIAVPTVFLGTYINEIIDNRITEIIIVSILSYVTIQLLVNQYVLKKKEIKQTINHKWYHIKLSQNGKLVNIFILSFIVFFAAMVTSLTGMGGGVILMPFLVMLIHLNFKESSPISHSIIMVTSCLTLLIGSFDIYGKMHGVAPVTGEELLKVALPMFIGAILGTFGAMFVKKYIKKEIVIFWILLSLIWISIAKMVYDLITNWNGIN